MAAVYENKKTIFDFFVSNTLHPLPHLHKELELIHVKNGGCRAIANNKEYHLHSGDLFLAFPYQVHYFLDPVPGDYSVHAFPASILVSMDSIINNNELINNVFHIEDDSPEAILLNNIRNTRSSYSIAERCAFITLIMTRLLPRCQLSPLKQSSSQTLKNILEYCSNHYKENISLNTLAEKLHLNKYYISHSINQQLNMRLNTFINSLRVKAACSMLENTDIKIAEIAQTVGYETIRSFNRAFVEIIGTTPKQYRTQVQNRKIPSVFTDGIYIYQFCWQ